MESDMVNFISDNKSILDNVSAIELINVFFENNLITFKLIESIDYGSQYNGFYTKHKSEKTQMIIRSSWQGLEYEILNKGKSVLLSDFDLSYKNIIACSKKNLEYTLAVFKRFIDEQDSSEM